MIATIILICLASGRFMINAVNHGKVKEESEYNLLTGLLSITVHLILFYYAGLFDKF